MGAISMPGDNPELTDDPTTQEIAHSLVVDRFAIAQDYADRAYQVAIGYLGAMAETTGVSIGWTPTMVESQYPTGIASMMLVDPTTPDIKDISVLPVEFNEAAPVMDEYNIIPLDIPEFLVPLPNFITPDVPESTVPKFLYSPPVEGTIVIPTDDIPAMPAVPILTDIQLPDDPVFSVPEFVTNMPVADLTPPDLVYSWNEAEYSSDIFNALRSKMIDGIVNGGAGMLPEVEQAIYDRATNRLDIDLQALEVKAYNEFAARGARLPQGSLVAKLLETQLQNTLAREDLSRDIIIKSADMAYQYSTFIIEKGIALERELMTLFNSVQQRSFDASKVLVEFAIKEFEVRVQAYQARLEAYKAESEVFKARIQAEVARAELFKSIIESRKLSLEMQSLMVDIYTKRVGAIETMAKIYSTRMEGAKTQAQIESIQIERFRALVEAHKAQIDGVTAEYNLYQAQLAGESEKAKMYSYQVDGYKSVVDAYKARSDVDINTLRAFIEKNKGEVEIYTANMEKYKADIQASVANAEIQAKTEGLKIQIYDGDVRKFTSVAAAMTDAYRASTSVDIANADINVKYGDMLARMATAEAEIQAELVKAKGQIASQLSSSALSSVSAGANLGYSQSRSDSKSQASSSSYSNSSNSSHSESHSVIEKNCCGE